MIHSKRSKLKFVFVILVFVLISTTNVSAAFTISQTDTSGYSDARTVGNPPICFYKINHDASSGSVEVCGDHNVPFGPEYCQMEVVMRFKAPESAGYLRVATTWCLSYMIETNYPIGTAKIEVRYVLYTDSYSGLESHSSGFALSVTTPWWGGHNTEKGIKSMSAEHSVLFDHTIQSGTWYRVAVQLYIYLDGEANAWSQVGVGNPVNLDVSEIMVYT
ncbi:MAG: hypothetical protein K9W43_08245 [Candidatus Thorarchaeota archaeon]|nr:hypothetical protein [Candidatus Thorarchaeota archaeon]